MQASKARFVSFISLFMLPLMMSVGCASKKTTSSVDEGWPQENPFAKADQTSFDSLKESHPSRFRLFFSGNVNGETDPCGCAINPKGGIDRRLNYISQASKESPFPYAIVDAGNALFASEKLDKTQAELLKKRAALVLRGNHLMKVVAQNVGYLDLTAGLEFLKSEAAKNQVELISANWVNAKGALVFKPGVEFDLGREHAMIVGLSRGFKSNPEGTEDLHVTDPVAALQKILAAQPEGKVIIVLSDMGTDKDKEVAAKVARPLIFVGARDLSSVDVPIHEGNSILVQGQLQGQQWGYVDVAWNPNGKAWYNLSLGRQFKDLWTQRGNEWTALAEKPDSTEKTQEQQILKSAKSDMLRFVPGDLKEKLVYDYKLVDMSVEFAKANELTPLMEKVKKSK